MATEGGVTRGEIGSEPRVDDIGDRIGRIRVLGSISRRGEGVESEIIGLDLTGVS